MADILYNLFQDIVKKVFFFLIWFSQTAPFYLNSFSCKQSCKDWTGDLNNKINGMCCSGFLILKNLRLTSSRNVVFLEIKVDQRQQKMAGKFGIFLLAGGAA
jgi:hypothetical protein